MPLWVKELRADPTQASWSNRTWIMAFTYVISCIKKSKEQLIRTLLHSFDHSSYTQTFCDRSKNKLHFVTKRLEEKFHFTLERFYLTKDEGKKVERGKKTAFYFGLFSFAKRWEIKPAQPKSAQCTYISWHTSLLARPGLIPRDNSRDTKLGKQG